MNINAGAPQSTEFWCNSNARTAQSFVQGSNLELLIGKDQFFGAAGQVISYQPPKPPVGYIAGTHLRTHIDFHRLDLKDVFFGDMDEPPSYRLPNNPVVVLGNVTLASWLQATLLTLLSLDSMFGAAGEVPSYDWPLPASYKASVALLTFLSELKQNLIGADTMFGAAGQPLTPVEFLLPRNLSMHFAGRGTLIGTLSPLTLLAPPAVITPPVVPPVVVAARSVNEVELGYALIRRFVELFRDR